MTSLDGLPREKALELVRKAKLADLTRWIATIPAEKMPADFLDTLGDDVTEEPFCLRLCLLVWIASEQTQVPKGLQLKAALAFLHQKDSLLCAGTGFGKTMMIVMAVLMNKPEDESVVIAISPLKRLQTSQRDSFLRYGIEAMAINEDTMATISDFDWKASGILTTPSADS
ncbi:hypothetical protein EST38_g12890 [Candolleomyces aberdarensis]|uniref:DEAD/DEAH-box helicase domain-containing protein n=1 Tax=Candolleomyces aberdarensis TaxID=2316362 RepID=A0A4Q2D3M1_9AGAR|nr:hypothetical protein EST38_g12890 [Candolleomyces aberdarensis]